MMHALAHGSKPLRLGLLALAALAQSLPAATQTPCASNHLRTWFPRGSIPGAGSIINAIATTPDGGRVAVATPGYVHQGMQIGKVWVLSGWGAAASVEAQLIPPIYNNKMRFGSALSFNESGDLLFVGAAADHWPGRVFAYRQAGGNWIQEWETVSTSGYDWLGASVAVDAAGRRTATDQFRSRLHREGRGGDLPPTIQLMGD
jgi:hypothetical protein